QVQPESQHHRARAVVDAHAIVRVGELQAEQDLCEVVSTRRELIEHLPLRQGGGPGRQWPAWVLLGVGSARDSVGRRYGNELAFIAPMAALLAIFFPGAARI